MDKRAYRNSKEIGEKMKQLNLIQGSVEWLACRRTHLGASDCAPIMGVNMFSRNKLKVFKEKVEDIQEKENDFMRYGKETEEEARLYYSLKYGVDFEPDCFESDEHPFMMASLDGWDGFTILEIKCPGEKTFREIQFTQQVPDGYAWQLQHQLYVVDEAKAAIIGFYYKGQDGIESVEIGVGRDQAKIASLIKEESIFWNENVLQLVPPTITRKARKKNS